MFEAGKKYTFNSTKTEGECLFSNEDGGLLMIKNHYENTPQWREHHLSKFWTEHKEPETITVQHCAYLSDGKLYVGTPNYTGHMLVGKFELTYIEGSGLSVKLLS